jgi:hypothetical protein
MIVRPWPGSISGVAFDGPSAGQLLGLGAAAITVYWQQGVLEARVWPLVT